MKSIFHPQSLLFLPEEISKKHLDKYDCLLSNINFSPLKDSHPSKGRNPSPQPSLLIFPRFLYTFLPCIYLLSVMSVKPPGIQIFKSINK
jgi:hypothetical protein